MSKSIAEAFQEQEGWTDTTLLDLCLIYIDNQQSDETFADFLSEHCAEEEEE